MPIGGLLKFGAFVEEFAAVDCPPENKSAIIRKTDVEMIRV